MLEEAIAHYHSLLDDAQAQASQAVLTKEMQERQLFFGERPLASVLRPRFISAAQYDDLAKACALVADATRLVADEVLRTTAHAASLRRYLTLTRHEEALIAMEPGYEDPSIHSRMDTFMTIDGSSLQFVEYNAESPAAIAYEDLLSEAFLELPVMRSFQERYRVDMLPARHKMHETLLDAWRSVGNNDEPHVAIVDWHGLPTAYEFELFRNYFEEQGLPTIICTPDDLIYREGKLYASSVASNKPMPISIVYKRILTSEFLEHYGDHCLAHPLVQAYSAGSIALVNNFRAKLLHKKSIFALLSDERCAKLFTNEQREAIAKHVPWTRLLEKGETSYQGERIDLLQFVQANRERLILKPNDDYGGHGITVGWESTPDAWDAALSEALKGHYVVQERVTVAYEDYPYLFNGRLEIGQRLVDTDPFLFGNQVVGGLCRLATGALLNVTAGGGSTIPIFVIAPK
jgi:uncharacterized circularly permuted ATP-grasp superfamily protein